MSFWRRKKELKFPKETTASSIGTATTKESVSTAAAGESASVRCCSVAVADGSAATGVCSGAIRGVVRTGSLISPQTISKQEQLTLADAAATGNHSVTSSASSCSKLKQSNSQTCQPPQLEDDATFSEPSQPSAKREVAGNSTVNKSDRRVSVSRSGRYKSISKQRSRILSDDGDKLGLQQLRIEIEKEAGFAMGIENEAEYSTAQDAFSFLDALQGLGESTDETNSRSTGSPTLTAAKDSNRLLETVGSQSPTSNVGHSQPPAANAMEVRSPVTIDIRSTTNNNSRSTVANISGRELTDKSRSGNRSNVVTNSVSVQSNPRNGQSDDTSVQSNPRNEQSDDTFNNLIYVVDTPL